MAEQVFDITEDSMTSTYSSTAMNTNYGTNAVLTAGNSGSYYYTSWWKLPLPTVPPGEEILSAKLMFTKYNAGTGQEFSIGTVDAAWSESTITHNNRPTATLAKTFTDPVVGQYSRIEIDITDVALDENGIAIWGTNGNYFQVYSREEATVSYRPQVVYEVGVWVAPDYVTKRGVFHGWSVPL